ncbi:MAG: hypothetical protein NC110_03000 [Ruminococcus sp.]|nr:hypothetical protein [Ruminococcus sp.]
MNQERKNNFKSGARLFIIKMVTVVICFILTWNAAKSALTVLQLYLDKPDYVMTIINGADELDYETNKVLKSEIAKTINSVLSYALDYQTDENTKFGFAVLYNIDQEVQRTKKQIELIKEVLPYQIENSIIEDAYIKNGFVDLTENPNGSTLVNNKHYDVKINNEKIDAYYNTQCADLIENCKRTNSTYCELSDYIKALDGVHFAVVNKASGAVISNVSTNETPLQSFRSKEFSVILSGGNKFGTMEFFDDYASEQAANYAADFDIYLSFDTLAFNNTCKQIAAECAQIRSEILLAIVQVMALISINYLLVFILMKLIRNQKSRLKFGKTPAVVFGVMLLILIAAAVYIIITTVIQVLTAGEPPAWIQVTNDFPFAIIKLSAAAISVYEIGVFSLLRKRN